MTTLFDPNEDALSVTVDQAAFGPLAGFFESFAASRDAQYRTSAQFGLEYALFEQDQKQAAVLRDAGIADPPMLNMDDAAFSAQFDYDLGGTYMDAARNARGREIDPESAKAIAEYDARITEIQRARPDLHLYTSKQMFEVVKRDARKAEFLDQTQRRTWGGSLGSFLGSTYASVSPTTDPFNFATLGVGGVGKTVLTRIASQAGAQGVIEGINQITGVQESRELLGLSYGWQDALTRAGGAALAGGLIQGGGELLVAGARRFFRSAPNDPAPPVEALVEPSKPLALPSPDQFKTEAGAARLEQNPAAYVDYLADVAPLSGLRVGRPRVAADLKEITGALDKWDAPPPAFLRPQASTAVFEAPVPTARLDVAPATRNNALYQAARDADPQAFTRFEKLNERAATLRRWIAELNANRDAEVQSTVEAIDNRIAALEARFRSVQGIKNKTDIKAQIKEARADKERVLKISEKKETPDIAAVRRDLAKTDEQMRDLAPLIGRAYAKARGEWAPDTALMDDVWNAYKAGRADVEVSAKDTLPDYDTAISMAQRVPVLQRATPETTGQTVAETVSKTLAAEAEKVREGLEGFRASMNQLFGATSDGKYRVGNHEFDLDADKIHIELEDGTTKEVSIREMLNENRETEIELEAITTCSMPRRS